MPLSDADVREILRLIDESPLQELQIETDGFSLRVRRGAPPPTSATPEDGFHTIEAPMLGTFYRAERPGEEPFVDIGSEVRHDTIVCIIEVMKMMNSVPAGVSGTVVEVCQQNAELVEYGAPLFRVQPS